MKGRARITAARLARVFLTTIRRVRVTLAAEEAHRVFETKCYTQSISQAAIRASQRLKPRSSVTGVRTTDEAGTGTCWIQEGSVCAAPAVHHRVPLCVTGTTGETRLKGPAALADRSAAAGVAGISV